MKDGLGVEGSVRIELVGHFGSLEGLKEKDSVTVRLVVIVLQLWLPVQLVVNLMSSAIEVLSL